MTNIAINGFLGRMGQSIFHESLNHKDIEITVGCDASDKIKSCKDDFNLILTSNLSDHDKFFSHISHIFTYLMDLELTKVEF